MEFAALVLVSEVVPDVVVSVVGAQAVPSVVFGFGVEEYVVGDAPAAFGVVVGVCAPPAYLVLVVVRAKDGVHHLEQVCVGGAVAVDEDAAGGL